MKYLYLGITLFSFGLYAACEEECKKAADKCAQFASQIPLSVRGNLCQRQYNKCLKSCTFPSTIKKKPDLRHKMLGQS